MEMETMQWVAEGLACGLLVYLTYAMLRPEQFA
jgi:K+-transporting ATPase KdpF subunit